MRKTNIIKTCHCGKSYKVIPSVLKKGGGKYCSNGCKMLKLWADPKYRTMQVKAHKGYIPTNLSQLAQMSKGNKHRLGHTPWNKGRKSPETSGANHYNWKGGKGTERHRIMLGLEYKAWRTSVFLRDNYTCQICEQYGGVLHADHIKKWSDNEELRYNVDNGRTLCVPCHYYITFRRKMKPGQRWCNYMARERG